MTATTTRGTTGGTQAAPVPTTGPGTNNGQTTTNNGNPQPTQPPPPPPPPTYNPVVHTAQALPSATGDIAKIFENIPIAEQLKITEELFTLFTTPHPNLMELNVGYAMTTALAIKPQTCEVKLIYGLGFGTAPLGSSSPIKGKLLALHGEGGEKLGHPEVIVLDSTLATTPVNCLVPTDTEVQTKLTATNGAFGNHLLAPNAVQTK